MSRGYCSGCLQPAVCEARGGCQGPSPHTDPGALLKLAAEIERACKAPNYEARLGTIEGKTVVAILRQAASHGSAGAAQARQERHEATYLRGWNEGIECAVEALEKEGWYAPQDTIRKLVEASPVPSASRETEA